LEFSIPSPSFAYEKKRIRMSTMISQVTLAAR
jgi:hypothetical protein